MISNIVAKPEVLKAQNVFFHIFLITVLLFSLSACQPSSNAEADLPILKMTTTYGEFFIELDVKNAPVTANNFLKYAEGGHFDELGFYRSVTLLNDNHELKIAVLQGGIDTALLDNADAAFAPIVHEATSETGLLHTRGSISMARGAIGTAQTEFFISTRDNAALDAGGLRVADGQGFAVFGRVVAGMDVVDRIANLPVTKAHADPYVKGQLLDDIVAIEVERVQLPSSR